ncbi:NADH-quinone oxidoreductase subunit J [Paenibacillus sp. N1-5-1-14]|uniref:NADH-quinone oxidoreductase subunit J n=1 Tax=Paenibacillus radicibacter TaxID=2972488 RepID=UPI0021591299|nr:NADH-quinone oxidoreductase subunit J [Paenibacillus radicibacter]MCR8645082.1 NADH-quinone oxidoreductase subunit J [Paenibacillus radicibacter]
MFSGLGDFLSSGQNIAFLVLAMFTIGGGLYMIMFTKVIHMLISGAVTFLSLAGIYLVLNAEFLAVVQILIYASAISILMIFGIMMTKHRSEEEKDARKWHIGFSFIGALGLFGILFYAIQTATFPEGAAFDPGKDNTLEIGKLLFGPYVIPFEIMSVLLTVAFIGAVIIAKREEE